MRIFLGLCGVLFLLGGVSSCIMGSGGIGAFGAIAGVISVAIGSGFVAIGLVLIGFAGIIEAIVDLRKTLTEEIRQLPRR